MNPISRLIRLVFVSYFIGIFYPLPKTLFHLVKGPSVSGSVTSIHTPDFVDFSVFPFISAPFGSSVVLAFPVAVFCIVWSAYDRWSAAHVTALGAASTFSMFFADDVAGDLGWLGETVIFAFSTVVLFGVYFAVAKRIAESGRHRV